MASGVCGSEPVTSDKRGLGDRTHCRGGYMSRGCGADQTLDGEDESRRKEDEPGDVESLMDVFWSRA